jgi:aspartate carbamoyltransferase catalytic subunit
MLDLHTIRRAHGRLDIRIAIAGDLRYGRTAHSLSIAMARFGASLVWISPPSLEMPEYIVKDLEAKGADITVTNDLYELIPEVDVLYMTRIQKERFPDEAEYNKVAGVFQLSKADLADAKEELIVMHPLPRVGELSPDVDSTPHAHYFKQAFNGVVTRMALLCRLLGIEVPAGGEA